MNVNSLQKAAQLANNRQFEKAREICEKLCRKNSKNTEAWQMLAAIHEAMGDFSAAVKCFAKIDSISPNDPQILCKLGVAFQKQGKMEEAIQSYKKSLKLHPDLFEARFYLGNALQKTGELDAAHSLFIDLLKHKKNLPEIHANIANIFYEKSEFSEALTHCNEAIFLKPSVSEIVCLKGRVLAKLERFEEAINVYTEFLKKDSRSTLALKGLSRAYSGRGNYSLAVDKLNQALGIEPQDIVALLNLGDLFQLLAQRSDAINCYEEVLKQQPENLSALCGLGKSYFGFHMKESKQYYTQALEVDSEHERAIAGLSEVYIADGNYEKAESMLESRIEKGSLQFGIIRTYAEVCNHLGEDGKAVPLLARYLEDGSGDAAERSQAHFKLGKLLDASNEYGGAFEHFKKANELTPQKASPSSQLDFIDQVQVAFTRERINILPRTNIESELPVFVVGMPRSGTSLVEQILDSHAMIHGAGERLDIQNAHHRLLAKDSFPGNIEILDADLLNDLSQKYIAALSELSENSLRIIDKLPHNFLYIGLIELMFPQARIIHCKRNALDTCLSIYFQNMDSSHTYAMDLSDLGKSYCAYLRIMEHWRQASGLSILNVDYEELVSDQEVVSRRMVEFCGLEWDESCLDFHNNKRMVATFSHSQVRKPMYNKSVDRWKHYQKHIDALFSALACERE